VELSPKALSSLGLCVEWTRGKHVNPRGDAEHGLMWESASAYDERVTHIVTSRRARNIREPAQTPHMEGR